MTDPPAEPTAPRWRRLLPDAVALAVVVAWALALRLWVVAGLDLRGLPGPGGVKMVHALAIGNFARDWGTWLVASALPLFGRDIVLAARTLVVCGSLAAVVGVMLATRAVAGRAAAVVAGLVAATWSQGVFVSFLVGDDGLAWGLAWVGLGLCWFGARAGWWGLPLAAAGTAVALLGVAVKVIALPPAAFLVIAPALVLPGPWRKAVPRILALAAVMGLVALWARNSFLPPGTRQVEEVPIAGLSAISAGLARLRAMPEKNPESMVMGAIAIAAAAGALLPARGPWAGRLPQRLVLGLLGVAALGFTAESVGDKLRPRHLLVPGFPVAVLAGVGLGIFIDESGRRLGRLHRRAAAMAWVLVVVAAVPLLFDTLAFVQAWARFRTRLEGAAVPTLPAPPTAWEVRYHRLNGLVFSDTSEDGAIDLFDLATTAPAGGVAGVALRDAREFHMLAAAGLAHHPAIVLEPARCCTDGAASAACAAAVVDALDAAGVRLVLPANWDRSQRIQLNQTGWTRLLTSAAQAAGRTSEPSPWWLVREPGGSGARAPCESPPPGRPPPVPR